MGTSVTLLKLIPGRILTVWGGAGKVLLIGSEDIQGRICFIHYQRYIFYHQKMADVPDEVTLIIYLSHFHILHQIIT